MASNKQRKKIYHDAVMSMRNQGVQVSPTLTNILQAGNVAKYNRNIVSAKTSGVRASSVTDTALVQIVHWLFESGCDLDEFEFDENERLVKTPSIEVK